MKPERLAAIRARDKAFRPLDGDGLELMNTPCHDDRRALLAEVDRLTEENGRIGNRSAAYREDERARIRAGVEGLEGRDELTGMFDDGSEFLDRAAVRVMDGAQ